MPSVHRSERTRESVPHRVIAIQTKRKGHAIQHFAARGGNWFVWSIWSLWFVWFDDQERQDSPTYQMDASAGGKGVGSGVFFLTGSSRFQPKRKELRHPTPRVVHCSTFIIRIRLPQPHLITIAPSSKKGKSGSGMIVDFVGW